MADIKIYEQRAAEAWYLHDPVSSAEVMIVPTADRDRIRRALDEGAVIIHQTGDGKREVATIDDLPEPEPVEELRLVAPDYVNARVDLIMAAINAVASALQGFLGQGRLNALNESLAKALEAIKNGDTGRMQTVAADLGVAEGPSIE